MPPKKDGELRYIEVLAEAYPGPISHTELAEEVGVSKAAVTKAKRKLREYCDLRELAYDKFVLKDDSANFGQLARLYFSKGKIVKLATSNFTISVLKRLNVHNKISEKWRAYGEIFEKDDTNLFMEIVIRNLSAARELERITKKVNDEEMQMMLHSMELMQQLRPILEKLELRIKDEGVMLRYLVFRDKVFALAMHELSPIVEQMEILKRLDGELKEVYKKVYLNTLDFYLRQ